MFPGNSPLVMYGYAVAICVFLVVYLLVKLMVEDKKNLPRAGRYLLWAIVAITSGEFIGSLIILNPLNPVEFSANLTLNFMFVFTYIFLAECFLYLIAMIYIGRKTGTLRLKRHSR